MGAMVGVGVRAAGVRAGGVAVAVAVATLGGATVGVGAAGRPVSDLGGAGGDPLVLSGEVTAAARNAMPRKHTGNRPPADAERMPRMWPPRWIAYSRIGIATHI